MSAISVMFYPGYSNFCPVFIYYRTIIVLITVMPIAQVPL